MIVANIVADVIIGMSPMFADKLVKGGTLICSGILNERAEEVRAALEKSGFTILSHEKSDDWSAFAAKSDLFQDSRNVHLPNGCFFAKIGKVI